MSYLLWSTLNVLVLLGICYILFRAAKLVWQHVGRGTALLLVLVLLILSNRSSSSPPEQNRNLLAKTSEHGPLANASAGQTIDLGGSNHLYLRAEFDSAKNTFTPHGLYAGVSGFMLGHRWEPISGMLHQQGDQLRYRTVFNHHWLLFGTTVFTSGGVEFEGLMKPDPPFAQR